MEILDTRKKNLKRKIHCLGFRSGGVEEEAGFPDAGAVRPADHSGQRKSINTRKQTLRDLREDAGRSNIHRTGVALGEETRSAEEIMTKKML